MTGRDLIIYILSNHLEDEPVFQNGNILGFVTIDQAAALLDVGAATVCAWIQQDKLTGIIDIGGVIYIPLKHIKNGEEK